MATVCRDKRMRNSAGRPAWLLNYTDINGLRKRERTEAQSREQANDLLRIRLKQIIEAKEKGLGSVEMLTERKSVTFEEFFQKTYRPYSESRHRPSWVKRTGQLAVHVLPYFGSMPLRSIIAGHIEKFLTRRTNANPRPANRELNLERAFLSRVLKHAFRNGLVDVKVCAVDETWSGLKFVYRLKHR